MTLPTSGNPIKFSEIETEFGGAPNNNIGAYRISAETYGGKSFSSLDTGIPTGSNPISWSNFHGKKLNVVIDCHTDCANERVNAKTEYTNNNVNCVGSGALTSPAASRNASDASGHKIYIRVNKTIGSATGSANNCALRTGTFESAAVNVDIGSSGKLMGAGGNGGAGADHGSGTGGDGGDGNAALGIDHSGTAVIIESGGTLQCGYGGGGGGGSDRDEDPGADRTAGGGGGGGGAGFPGGGAGTGGTEGNDGPGNNSHSGGSAGGGGSTPAGGEQGGGGGNGGNNANEAIGGNGGRGGDQENAAGGGGTPGGDGGGSGGSAGGNGSAIRKASDEIAYTFSESGSETGGTANTGSESGGSHIGVA